ncbi:MAG: Do family serine endopeptidase [candidate division WOR-3 bacterium]|nr:Do family serine endopeptidase [candidate division WOR-3 bacterium]MCX7947714.1 Do family serine endopeptidase [candidate division WOR-3 bacterium]MDW8150363.1 Do family serine endopeptidase [candidate division WOR-3 bacterium]
MRKKLLIVASLIGLGIAVGMLISSNLNIFNKAVAQSQTIQTPQKVLSEIQVGFTQIAEAAIPSVVNISAIGRTTRRTPSEFEELFRRFFGEEFEFPFPEVPRSSLGSGFIFRKEGKTYYVMTNHHVIKNGDKIKITLSDGTNIENVKVVGADPRTDIAVLKFESSKDIPVLKLGNSDEVRVGQWVIAIGSPFGLSSTVTVGVISSIHRKNIALPEGPDYQDFLQTDAAINPGNSGGPLLNINGEVIGVNTAIATPTGVFAGIGFAVPINLAKNITEQLITKGTIERGYLGIRIQDVTPELAQAIGLPEQGGALVNQVIKGEAADKAGIREGDIILEVDKRKIKDANDLRLYIGSLPPGKEVELKIYRDKKYITIKAKLGKMPEKISQIPSERESETTSSDTATWLGMTVTEKNNRVVVINSQDKALEIGIRPGDVIIKIGDIAINSLRDFIEAKKRYEKSDRPILIVVENGGIKRFLAITPIQTQ